MVQTQCTLTLTHGLLVSEPLAHPALPSPSPAALKRHIPLHAHNFCPPRTWRHVPTALAPTACPIPPKTHASSPSSPIGPQPSGHGPEGSWGGRGGGFLSSLLSRWLLLQPHQIGQGGGWGALRAVLLTFKRPREGERAPPFLSSGLLAVEKSYLLSSPHPCCSNTSKCWSSFL